MKKWVEMLANVGTILVCALIAFSLIAHKTLNIRSVLAETPTRKVEMPLNSNWYALGRADASVTIVEFMDLQCPYCRQFERDVLPGLKKEYIETGKLRFITMDLPLPIHTYAFDAAEAERCAGEEGKFWQFRTAVLDEQQPPEPSILSKIAAALNLNSEQFETCLKSGNYKAVIQANQAAAAGVGIDATPGFVIGRLTGGIVRGVSVSGAQPFSFFQREIETMLK